MSNMPYIDNQFQSTDKNIKFNTTQNPKKVIQLPVSLGKLSEVKDIENLKIKSRITNMYKDICQKVNLNEQIRPELEFDIICSGAPGGFDATTGKMYFDDNFIKKLDNKSLVFIIRHELEHVKQFQDISRMLGMEKFTKLLVFKDENYQNEKGRYIEENVNIDYYKKVEQTLGKIDKNSPEGIRVQKYVEAVKKYPDLVGLWQRSDISELKKMLLFAKEFIVNYKFNLLEREANKAAKIFIKNFKV